MDHVAALRVTALRSRAAARHCPLRAHSVEMVFEDAADVYVTNAGDASCSTRAGEKCVIQYVPNGKTMLVSPARYP